MTTERQLIEKLYKLLDYMSMKETLTLEAEKEYGNIKTEIASLEKELEQEPELTAEDFWQSKNGGKSSDDCTRDFEFITPIFAVQLMEQYARQKLNLREELFNFNSWMCGKQYDGQIPLIETCIDEYLKSRQ